MANGKPRSAAHEPAGKIRPEVREGAGPAQQSPAIAQAIDAGGALFALLGPAANARGETQAAPHYHGHRDRLRERFRHGGADALPDYELLELVLFRTMRQGDTKPLAKRLIEKFGSFAEVLNAPAKRLAEVKGVGEATITDLMLIAASAARITKGAVKQQLTLGSWSAVIEYCRTAMAFADKEHFRILFLDKRNQLIADEVQQTGTIDHTPVYPREVVKRALELSATALILVHNHPSGDPTPSNADIQMTKQIAEIAGHLGIAVHDHIIVGRGGHASLKGLKLM